MQKTSIAERLRLSKQASDKRMFDEGFALGREWAKASAEAEDLERLALEEHPYGSFNDIRELAEFLGVELEWLVGDTDDLTARMPSFVAGFVKGAREVFDEHSGIFDILVY